jgi:hypothetical protein
MRECPTTYPSHHHVYDFTEAPCYCCDHHEPRSRSDVTRRRALTSCSGTILEGAQSVIIGKVHGYRGCDGYGEFALGQLNTWECEKWIRGCVWRQRHLQKKTEAWAGG